MRGKSPLQNLLTRPRRFKFDAAVRLLWLAAKTETPGEAIRFNSPPSLTHPVAEVEAAEPALPDAAPRLSSGMIGLVGPAGTLPRWYTELVAQSLRARSPAMAAFFDLLAQRLTGHFAWAGAKYRAHRAVETAQAAGTPDPVGAVLLSLTGHVSDHLASRVAVGTEALQHYAGFFSAWPRSADRLAALASDWLGRPVALREFAGSWLPIPPDQRSALPRGRNTGAAFNRLGQDCAAGVRAFDCQARFILRVGPLSRAEFEAMLPDRPKLARFVSLIRSYVGMETDFAVNLVLDPAEIPPLRLGGADAPRLGWTCWLPSATAALTGHKPADQALFSASLVESIAHKN